MKAEDRQRKKMTTKSKRKKALATKMADYFVDRGNIPSRKEFSKHTPKMESIKVDKKDIATVIGKGGATIREIVETSGAKVDVKDTGEVTVAAPDEASRNKAIDFIKN